MKSNESKIVTSQTGIFLAKHGVSNWRVKEKGITLIALVITVIVLLILAGAAISISINGRKFVWKSFRSKSNNE